MVYVFCDFYALIHGYAVIKYVPLTMQSPPIPLPNELPFDMGTEMIWKILLGSIKDS